MKENNNTIKAFAIDGQPLPKPRMTSRSKFFDKHYKKYWEYLNSASEIIWATMKQNGWKTIEGDAGVSFIFKRKGLRRLDIDNAIKSQMEILAKAKVVINDSQIIHIKDAFIFYGQDDPKTIVEIWQEEL